VSAPGGTNLAGILQELEIDHTFDRALHLALPAVDD